MTASLAGRELLKGLWCEAWDDGVIEWRPIRLKARIFPNDNISVEEVLEELVRLNFIKKFSISGIDYAAIRKFRKWQSPQRPNSSNVLPADLCSFVSLPENEWPNPPPIRDQSHTGTGNLRQKGEYKKGEEKDSSGKVEGDFFPPPDDPPGQEPGGGQSASEERPKPRQQIGREMVDDWNEIVGQTLGKVQKITPPRMDRMNKILRDEFNGAPGKWRDFVNRVGRSDFLTGSSAAGWKADFDWCLKPANFVKIVEGRYDNARNQPAAKTSHSASPF